MLFILVPGGIEEVVRATSEPALTSALPPPAEEEPDLERIKTMVAAHGYERLV